MAAQIIQRLKNFKQLAPLLRKSKGAIDVLSRVVTRPPELMLHSSKQTLVEAVHASAALASEDRLSQIGNGSIADLYLFKQVLYYPLGAGQKTDHTGGLIDFTTKLLIKEATHYNGEYVQELPAGFPEQFNNDDLPELQPIVLYGGILFNNFGHFLLESLGRLWAYDYVKDLDPYILFHLTWKEPDYLSKKNFVYMVLQGFRIPHKKILFIDSPTILKNVLVPAQKYGYEYCRRPDEIFLKFMRTFSFPHVTPAEFVEADNVYVSRSKIPSHSGKVIGESMFEEYLSSNGYKIFYPERYNLYQQLSVYNKAKKLIFCDGSALHACILLPGLQAAVSVIARRKDARWNCEDIIDQFKGYGQKAVWIDGVKTQYQYGMESWNAISVIDWYLVSKKLMENNFIKEVIEGFNESSYQQLIRSELKGFIQSIQHQPKFIEFMEELTEK